MRTKPFSSANQDTVNSVVRALSILEVMARARREVSISELHRELGLSLSTLHRLLATMQKKGFVHQNPNTMKYGLGLKAFEVGSAFASQMGAREYVISLMGELAKLTGETINLAVLDSTEVVFLDKIESKEPLRIGIDIGTRVPSYCSALGKVLLAYLPPEELEAKLALMNFKKYTQNTITDQERFRREIGTIRQQGFSLDNEEYVPGIRCLGAPIRDRFNRVIAALSVAGPTLRLTDERLPEITRMLKETADKISGVWR